MDLAAARADLRRAHVNGGAGVLVSGLVWLLSGMVWLGAGQGRAFIVLFFGGMAIAPVAQLVSKFAFKAPPSTLGKRLEWIAIATVPILLAGFYVAWRRMDAAPDAAIATVAIAVGLRYLAFPMMFGRAHFVALGAIFIGLGAAGLLGWAPPAANLAVVLGAAELVCAWLLCSSWHARGSEG